MATHADAVISRPTASPLAAHRPNPWFNVLAGVIVVVGIIYAGYHLANDLSVVRDTRAYPFVLLGIALFIALGFEFVNGFHDTANAVATVIYTRSLPANFAVVWSGMFNLAGVLASSGAVAFGIISLLPVELILQVGSSAGFAMVFALLIAAIIWNLGTWAFGLPASSSHTLIGSIIGVGVANAMLHGRSGTSRLLLHCCCSSSPSSAFPRCMPSRWAINRRHGGFAESSSSPARW
jgi:PiT family inorganic phosphate transporter